MIFVREAGAAVVLVTLTLLLQCAGIAALISWGRNIPSFGLSACRNRKVVTSRLINPIVDVEFHQISNRGKKLPPGADEFSAFLKSFIVRGLATSVLRNVTVGTHDSSGRHTVGLVSP